MTNEYRFDIESFLVSPAHAYFGRAKDRPAADVTTQTPDIVELRANKGIVGDRFFGVRAHTEAAVTFLALEAWETAAGDADPVMARRNVMVRGLELDPLRAESSRSTPATDLFGSAAAGRTSLYLDGLDGRRRHPQSLIGRGVCGPNR